MLYPNKLKEFFDPDGGINTILVKNGSGAPPPPPPIENPCSGATDLVELQVSYRGSDWYDGIRSSVEVNGEVWNPYNEDSLIDDWGDFAFRVGGHIFVTTYEGRGGRATLQILPHKSTDYVIVKIIPDDGDPEGNKLLGVVGGGNIDYNPQTTIASFCMKPNLKQPISCYGASDQLLFSIYNRSDSRSLAAVIPEPLGDLIYNVTADGVDYGVVNFSETPNPMFGRVGLSYTHEPTVDEFAYSLKLTNAVIGVGHRFYLQHVESMGGNNIAEIINVVSENPPVTVDHDPHTRDVELCLMALSQCDGASDSLRFGHYEYGVDPEPTSNQRFPLIYNVTVDDVDYGEINFIDEEEAGTDNIRVFGDYSIRYEFGRWGSGSLNLISGPIGVPTHIKLDPVERVVSNINYPEYNRTVVYNNDTKAVEFCLVRGECSGATEELVLVMEPGILDSPDFSGFYHSFEMDGLILNEDHSINLLDDWGHSLDGGSTDFIFSTYNENNTLTISLENNRTGGTRKLIMRAPPSGPNHVASVDFISNPTAVMGEDGELKFCLEVYQPR